MYKSEPKISVIMTAYNESQHIEDSIISILNQTYTDFELITINDCSTDNTLQKIKTFDDERIVLIDNTKNLGRAKSRNEGLKIARGKYIAILDSGDTALPHRLEKQFNFLEKNEEIFLIGSGANNIDMDSNIINSFIPITNPDKIKKIMPKQNCFYHVTVMLKNEGFLYREKFYYAQDYDFYLQMLSKNKKISNIKDILVNFRINDNSISQQQRGRQSLFAQKAQEMYFQRLKNNKDDYADFDPQKIMTIDENNTNNKIFIRGEISSSYQMNDFKRLKKLIKRYYRDGIVFDMVLIFYFLSILPNWVVIKFKNIIYRAHNMYQNLR